MKMEEDMIPSLVNIQVKTIWDNDLNILVYNKELRLRQNPCNIIFKVGASWTAHYFYMYILLGMLSGPENSDRICFAVGFLVIFCYCRNHLIQDYNQVDIATTVTCKILEHMHCTGNSQTYHETSREQQNINKPKLWP